MLVSSRWWRRTPASMRWLGPPHPGQVIRPAADGFAVTAARSPYALTSARAVQPHYVTVRPPKKLGFFCCQKAGTWLLRPQARDDAERQRLSAGMTQEANDT